VRGLDAERLPAVPLPLVEAVRDDDAAPGREQVSKRGPAPERLGPSVDRPLRLRERLRPPRDEAPAQLAPGLLTLG
jgi:hypothetical protein